MVFLVAYAQNIQTVLGGATFPWRSTGQRPGSCPLALFGLTSKGPKMSAFPNKQIDTGALKLVQFSYKSWALTSSRVDSLGSPQPGTTIFGLSYVTQTQQTGLAPPIFCWCRLTVSANNKIFKSDGHLNIIGKVLLTEGCILCQRLAGLTEGEKQIPFIRVTWVNMWKDTSICSVFLVTWHYRIIWYTFLTEYIK